MATDGSEGTVGVTYTCSGCGWSDVKFPPNLRCPSCDSGTIQVHHVALPGHFQVHSREGITYRSTPGVRRLNVGEETGAFLVKCFAAGGLGPGVPGRCRLQLQPGALILGVYSIGDVEVWVCQTEEEIPTVMLPEEYGPSPGPRRKGQTMTLQQRYIQMLHI